MLTSTIPLTLTARLGGGELDPTAGLVYVGDGRYYDAALGLPLQPDPFGGAPEAPESLNRYAAAGVSTLPTLGSVPSGKQNYQDFAAEVASTTANKTLGYYAEERLTPGALTRAGLSSLGKTTRSWKPNPKTARDFFVRLRISYPGISSKRWLSDQIFQPIISGRLYLNVNTGDIIDVRKTFLDPRIEEVPWRKLGGQWDETAPGFGARLARFGFDNALPFFIDFAWQAWADRNTDMPGYYQIGRATVAGVVGLAAGKYLIAPIAGYIAGAFLGAATAPAWLTIGVGVVIGITVEALATHFLNNLLFPID